MSDDATIQLQHIIDRMQQGDSTARRELLERACNRLRKLAGKLMSGSFPVLKNQHEVDSIVHESWLRLAHSLEKTNLPTVADFFRFAAFKIRQVLLDMVEKHRKLAERMKFGLNNSSINQAEFDSDKQTLDPTKLMVWSEFHQHVSELPDLERSVFEMHYYLELPQVEIAKILELSPRKVSYLWVAATERLADQLGEITDLL
jgi:RNA polymerase sigma factor (sigma-70 family)